MSDHDWLAGYSHGWDGGRKQGDSDARVILCDLIADLRGCPDAVAPTRDDLVVMADHYAARLREVTGDE